MEYLDWLARNPRYTARYALHVGALCRKMTVKDVAQVKLYFSKNGGAWWRKINTLLKNSGEYTWYVPALSETRQECRVKVVLKDARGRQIGRDVSDGVFTIEASP